MMYYCERCKELFDEEEAHYEDCGFWCEFWGHDVYNEAYEMQCPHCRGTDFEEAPMCDVCREYFTPDELDENDLCECCREERGEEDDGITN